MFLSAPLLNQVVKAVGKYSLYMIVCKEVENGLALSAVAHKVCLLEGFKLVRDGGLSHTEQFGNGTHAQLGVDKSEENLYSCGVSENLKEIGKIAQQLVGGQLMPHAYEDFIMVMHHMSLRSFESLFI